MNEEQESKERKPRSPNDKVRIERLEEEVEFLKDMVLAMKKALRISDSVLPKL